MLYSGHSDIFRSRLILESADVRTGSGAPLRHLSDRPDFTGQIFLSDYGDCQWNRRKPSYDRQS